MDDHGITTNANGTGFVKLREIRRGPIAVYTATEVSVNDLGENRQGRNQTRNGKMPTSRLRIFVATLPQNP